ncbi:MAG TPA: peptide chain release factor N(5)-glutamine methyltransferase [bacterium]|nr:peptide chain release factor N(5)-glutamine methyltransferase [bacterium]
MSSVSPDIWTVKSIMDWTIRYLTEKNIESARTNVEWLLCHTLSCKRMDLYINYDRPLDQKERDEFKTLLKRRLQAEPLQYIVGHTDFMGLTFQVNRDVLIPRPDTELLVERVLDLCGKNDRQIRILDIGTGSGAIIIGLVHYLLKRGFEVQGSALDISQMALAVAKNNSNKNLTDTPIQWQCGDIFESALIESLKHRFDIIVSNPPYISDKEYALLDKEVRDYEPATALKADDNGLAFYHRIGHIASDVLDPSSPFGYIALEVGYDQANAVAKILHNNGYTDQQRYKDIQNHERVIIGKK